LVRFLRNTLVAKVAGADSQLLQISSDERARVGRVAETFSEEDLTRFLQIMLRTHAELGYRQEQRFHLELGILKLVHAQRILPLEQLLSGEAAAEPTRAMEAPTRAAASPGAPARAASPAAGASPFGAPTRGMGSGPSPFELDRSRKTGRSGPEMSAEPVNGSATAVAPAREIRGLASQGVYDNGSSSVYAASRETETAVALEDPPPERSAISAGTVRDAVLNALENAGQKMLVTMLEEGEWSLPSASELLIRVAGTPVVVEMYLGKEGQPTEARRLLNSATLTALGVGAKVRVEAGAAVASARRAPRQAPAGSARARAVEDPVVRRIQERFGAEIRTVIDHRDKR
jgi:DNA polymerase-3 subunit gamma/tau